MSSTITNVKELSVLRSSAPPYFFAVVHHGKDEHLYGKSKYADSNKGILKARSIEPVTCR